MIADGPFREIYEISEFKVAQANISWTEASLDARLRVALSLKAGGTTEGAEFWVLRDDPVAELNRFVQNADDSLLSRLAFAVGESDGKTTIVLRIRPSRLPPPVVVLNAAGYRPYLKLPNLFLPAGLRLHPPLRRDVVRSLLADDPEQVVWLTPLDDGSFVPESLPEDAFRPLTDWIDYILDKDQKALQAWMQSMTFDFESFLCAEEEPPKPQTPPPDQDKAGKRSRSGRGKDAEVSKAGGKKAKGELNELSKTEVELNDDLDMLPVEMGEVPELLRQREEQFLAIEGGLDVAERLALWPELAQLHAALHNHDESGLCWANAFWYKDKIPPNWAASWYHAAAASVPLQTELDLTRLVALAEPGVAEVRALAAYLIWNAARKRQRLRSRRALPQFNHSWKSTKVYFPCASSGSPGWR